MQRKINSIRFAVVPLFFIALVSARGLTPQEPAKKVAGLQQASTRFAVIAVHKSRDPDEKLAVDFTADGVNCTGITFQALLKLAYSLDGSQISGLPKWAESAAFDIKAKVEDDELADWRARDPAEIRDAVKALVAEAFQARLHLTKKIVPVLELEIANRQALLAAKAKDGSDSVEAKTSISVSDNSIKCDRVPISALATILSEQLGKQVVDHTGVQGTFSFELRWREDSIRGNDGASDLPDLATALREQLGIRLASRKNEADVLVVESATEPTGN